MKLSAKPEADFNVELSTRVLKVDVDQVAVACGVLEAAGLRTQLIDARWPGSRTRQFEILWGNQSAEERAADLMSATRSLGYAGYDVSAGIGPEARP